MAKRPECYRDEDVHQGYDNTGQTKPPSRPGGKHWEIWRCQCGKKTLDVLPGTKRSW